MADTTAVAVDTVAVDTVAVDTAVLLLKLLLSNFRHKQKNKPFTFVAAFFFMLFIFRIQDF
jgi:hypothetical protein